MKLGGVELGYGIHPTHKMIVMLIPGQDGSPLAGLARIFKSTYLDWIDFINEFISLFTLQ